MSEILDRYRYEEAKRIKEKQDQSGLFGPQGIGLGLQQEEEKVFGKSPGGLGDLLDALFSIVAPWATFGSIGAEKLAPNHKILADILGGTLGGLAGNPESLSFLIDKLGGEEGEQQAKQLLKELSKPESAPGKDAPVEELTSWQRDIAKKIKKLPLSPQRKLALMKEVRASGQVATEQLPELPQQEQDEMFGKPQSQEERRQVIQETIDEASKNLGKVVGATGKKETTQKLGAMEKVLRYEGDIHSAQVKAMLMNPRISVQKLLTDSINLPVQAIFKGVGVGMDQGIPAGAKTTLAALHAYRTTFKDAIRYGQMTFRSGDPEFLKHLGMDNPTLTFAGESEKFWINSDHAAGLRYLKNIYGAGSRMIMSADQFAKALAYSGEIRMGGFIDGLEQAEKHGLVGASKYHFADIWSEKLFNDTPDWLHEQATQGMMKATFTDQGTIMKWIEQGRSIPGVRIAVPFFRTPMNLMKAGLEISPLNMSAIWKGDLEQNVALGKQVVGSALAYEIFEQTMRGNITGDGPQGAGRTSWPEYKHPRSIRILGQWHSYKNMGPFAEILSLSADTAEMYNGSQKPEGMQRLVDAVGQVFASQVEHAPFWEEMYNIGHVLDSWKEGRLDKTGSEFLTRIATSFEPSPIRYEAQIEDPVVHNAQSLRDDFAEITPGWGKHVGLPTTYSVPAKQDIFGYDMHPAGAYNSQGGVSKLHYLANQLNPFPSYPDTKPDPVDEEIWKLGWQPKAWPTAYWTNPEPGARDIPEANVPLSAQQQKELADYAGHDFAPGGLNMHDRMLRMIQSPIYQRLDLVGKKQQLEGIHSGYLAAGMGYISKKYPELEQQSLQKQREAIAQQQIGAQ